MATTTAISQTWNAPTRKWEMPDESGVSKVLIFDAVLRESHSKRAQITSNPVETGVSMTDHAFMEPDELTLEVAVSDTPINGEDGDATLFAGGVKRTVSAYAELEAWMQAFIPFTVVTGLKTYQNLMVASIQAEQNKDSAGGLKATVQLRQVIFASTATAIFPPRSTGKAKRNADPPKKNGEKKAEEPTDTQKEKAKSLLSGLLGVGA